MSLPAIRQDDDGEIAALVEVMASGVRSNDDRSCAIGAVLKDNSVHRILNHWRLIPVCAWSSSFVSGDNDFLLLPTQKRGLLNMALYEA